MQVEEKPAEKAQRSLRFEDPEQKVPYLCIRPLGAEVALGAWVPAFAGMTGGAQSQANR